MRSQANRCAAYTADVSELGAIRARMQRPGDWDILPDRISQEPLAQLVRADDPQFYDILRWTVFALIEAERLGVTSANVDEMKKRERVEVQRLLGVVPGNGKALGLSETWAYNVIKALGNYGEMFDRNVGRGSPIGLERGLNRLWTDGGLMYCPAATVFFITTFNGEDRGDRRDIHEVPCALCEFRVDPR